MHDAHQKTQQPDVIITIDAWSRMGRGIMQRSLVIGAILLAALAGQADAQKQKKRKAKAKNPDKAAIATGMGWWCATSSVDGIPFSSVCARALHRCEESSQRLPEVFDEAECRYQSKSSLFTAYSVMLDSPVSFTFGNSSHCREQRKAVVSDEDLKDVSECATVGASYYPFDEIVGTWWCFYYSPNSTNEPLSTCRPSGEECARSMAAAGASDRFFVSSSECEVVEHPWGLYNPGWTVVAATLRHCETLRDVTPGDGECVPVN